MDYFCGSSSSNSFGSYNEKVLIKARKCKCIPPRVAEVRVSNSEANTERMYYKCKFCNLCKWVAERSWLGLVESSMFMMITLNCKGLGKLTKLGSGNVNNTFRLGISNSSNKVLRDKGKRSNSFQQYSKSKVHFFCKKNSETLGIFS